MSAWSGLTRCFSGALRLAQLTCSSSTYHTAQNDPIDQILSLLRIPSHEKLPFHCDDNDMAQRGRLFHPGKIALLGSGHQNQSKRRLTCKAGTTSCTLLSVVATVHLFAEQITQRSGQSNLNCFSASVQLPKRALRVENSVKSWLSDDAAFHHQQEQLGVI